MIGIDPDMTGGPRPRRMKIPAIVLALLWTVVAVLGVVFDRPVGTVVAVLVALWFLGGALVEHRAERTP